MIIKGILEICMVKQLCNYISLMNFHDVIHPCYWHVSADSYCQQVNGRRRSRVRCLYVYINMKMCIIYLYFKKFFILQKWKPTQYVLNVILKIKICVEVHNKNIHVYWPRKYDFDRSNDSGNVYEIIKKIVVRWKEVNFCSTYFTELTAQCLTSLRTASDTRVRLWFMRRLTPSSIWRTRPPRSWPLLSLCFSCSVAPQNLLWGLLPSGPWTR